MVRKRQTKAVSKADSAAFMAKAEQFLGTMEQALAAEHWDSAGLQAVHAVISGADALVSYYGGVRSAEQDHRGAAGLLRETLGPDATSASRHISAVVAKKNAVEYDQRRLSEKEAQDMADHARRLLAWGRQRLP